MTDAPRVEDVARKAGVHGPFARAPGGLNVVWLGPTAVIKLYHPRDADEAAVERDALLAAAGRLPCPVPRVLDHGAADGWTWLAIARLPGRRAIDLWPALDRTARRRCVDALADALVALHALPPPPSVRERRGDVPAWLASEWPTTRERHLHEGLPAALVATFVAPPPLPPVFAHGDLHDENVLIDASGAVTGLLDFGDALAAPAAFDLVSPLVHFGRGDPELVRALRTRLPVDVDALAALAVAHPWAELAAVRPRDRDHLKQILGG